MGTNSLPYSCIFCHKKALSLLPSCLCLMPPPLLPSCLCLLHPFCSFCLHLLSLSLRKEILSRHSFFSFFSPSLRSLSLSHFSPLSLFFSLFFRHLARNLFLMSLVRTSEKVSHCPIFHLPSSPSRHSPLRIACGRQEISRTHENLLAILFSLLPRIDLSSSLPIVFFSPLLLLSLFASLTREREMLW